MRTRRSSAALVVALSALLGAAGCGAREPAQQPYPYPAAAPVATPLAAYPSPAPEPTVAVLGAAPTVEMLIAAPVFGLVVDGDMRIVHVEPGGGGDQGGLRPGDLLQSIAGVAVSPDDPASLRAARDAAVSGQPAPPAAGAAVPFVVERDGATLTLSVAPGPPGVPATSGQPLPTATPVLPPYDYI